MIPFTILAEQAAAAVPNDTVAPPVTPVSIAALARFLTAVAAPAWLFVAGRLLHRRSPLEYEGRQPVSWSGADVLMVGALSFLIQSLLPLWTLGLFGFEVTAGGKLPADAELPFRIAQAVAGIGAFAIAVAWLKARAGADCESLGCSLRRWRHDLASGLIAATFIIPPIMAVQAVVTSQLPSEHPLITLIKKNHALLPVVTVLAVVVAPLFEEFLFRVALQGWLEKAELTLRRSAPEKFSLPRGVLPILISSLVFAAAHFDHGADPLPLFLFALVLGYLYRQTHRLWPSLVLHTALNGLTAVVMWSTALK